MVNPYRFYTYAYLREDKTPYYIGKGKGKRIYSKRHNVSLPPKDKNRIIFLKQNLTEEAAFKHEMYMIAVFGRKDLGTGILYNRTNGGEGMSGWIMPDDVKKKLSLALKGNKYCVGREIGEDTREKISKANTGKVSFWKGKSLPKELVEKMKLTKKMKGDNIGEKNPRAKTWKITFDDGKYEIVKSLNTWARENGYKPTSVRNLYNGRGVRKYKNIVSVQELAQDT